jgi:TRAP-type C4-dicarboxylate transport system substrate-binding protein
MRHAFFFVAALTAGSANAEPAQLKFGSTAPPLSLLNGQVWAPWIKDVEADSGGTVAIQLFTGTQLGTVYNIYDRTLNRVTDISFGLFGPLTDQFPRTMVVSQPFERQTGRDASLALTRLVTSGVIAEEYRNIKPLALFIMSGSVIHSKKPIRNLADLKGVKLAMEARANAQIIERLGGTPVTMVPPEMYQALQRGVVEGTAIGWMAVGSFKFDEVTSAHLNEVMSTSPAFVFMNRESFAALPEKARAAVDKHSGEAFALRVTKVAGEMEATQIARVAALPNHAMNRLDDAERARWKERTQPLTQEWIDKTPDGAKVLAAYRSELAKLQGETR